MLKRECLGREPAGGGEQKKRVMDGEYDQNTLYGWMKILK
jgi:hypothetical protein